MLTPPATVTCFPVVYGGRGAPRSLLGRYTIPLDLAEFDASFVTWQLGMKHDLALTCTDAQRPKMFSSGFNGLGSLCFTSPQNIGYMIVNNYPLCIQSGPCGAVAELAFNRVSASLSVYLRGRLSAPAALDRSKLSNDAVLCRHTAHCPDRARTYFKLDVPLGSPANLVSLIHILHVRRSICRQSMQDRWRSVSAANRQSHHPGSHWTLEPEAVCADARGPRMTPSSKDS